MDNSSAEDVSLRPPHGWHCSHLFYRFDRTALGRMSAAQVAEGRHEFQAVLDPAGSAAPVRLQASIVSGHKADFGLMLLDPDPLTLDALHQRLLASHLGAAILPTYSFVSLTEVSEYVPTTAQYGKRVIDEGEVEDPFCTVTIWDNLSDPGKKDKGGKSLREIRHAPNASMQALTMTRTRMAWPALP